MEEVVFLYNDVLCIDLFFVEVYNGCGNVLMDFGYEDGIVVGRWVNVIECLFFILIWIN